MPVALLLALLARLDRRRLRAPRPWLWADRALALAVAGSMLTVAFVRARPEVGALAACLALLLAVETAGQRWRHPLGD